MGYIKHEWKKDDIIYASLLNEMEDGIEAANQDRLVVYLVEENEQYVAQDKDGNPITIAEIYTTYNNNIEVMLDIEGTDFAPTIITEDSVIAAVPGELKEYGFDFVSIYGDGDDRLGADVWTVEFYYYTIPNLPDPDHQAGKIVGVDNNYEFTLIDPPSGGSNNLVVYLNEEDDTITAEDKDGNPISITEIYTAWENGSTIMLSYNEMIVTPMVITEEMCIGVFFGDMKETRIEYVVMQGMYDSEEEVDNWATESLMWRIYGLPDPDHEYGKFLSVDNQGEYVLVDAPGGEKEKYIVTFEQNQQDEWEATHDGTVVTPKTVYQQYAAGKEIQLVFRDTVIPLSFITEYDMFGYQFFDIRQSEISVVKIYGSYEEQEDEWTIEEIVYDMSGGGGGASALDDDELLGVFEDVNLFDAVYVTESNTDYILSDESDNILMW